MRTLVSTLLMLAVATPASAEQTALGRLFFTPAQRSALDADRKLALERPIKPAQSVEPVAQVKKEAPKPKAVAPQVVTLNGVVRRSDGQSTIWVNNKAIQNANAAGDAVSGSVDTHSADVKIGATSNRVQLKVGQTISSATGKIEDTYTRRRTPKYVAPPERDSSPASPEGKSSDATDSATAAGTTETSNSPAR